MVIKLELWEGFLEISKQVLLKFSEIWLFLYSYEAISTFIFYFLSSWVCIWALFPVLVPSEISGIYYVNLYFYSDYEEIVNSLHLKLFYVLVSFFSVSCKKLISRQFLGFLAGWSFLIMIHLVGLGTVPTGHTNQLINCPERHMNVSFNSFMMKVFII